MDFRGERRRNQTHASTTDPEARLLRKGPGQEAKLSFLGHALMGNRHGLLMDFAVSPATGTAERDAVSMLLDRVRKRGYRPRTLGADRGYDTKDCVKTLQSRRVTPHVAQKKHSVIDGRTTCHAGYAVNLRIRKQVEEVFGWMKMVGGLRRTRYRGRDRTGLAAYHLVRMAKLMAAQGVSQSMGPPTYRIRAPSWWPMPSQHPFFSSLLVVTMQRQVIV